MNKKPERISRVFLFLQQLILFFSQSDNFLEDLGIALRQIG